MGTTQAAFHVVLYMLGAGYDGVWFRGIGNNYSYKIEPGIRRGEPGYVISSSNALEYIIV